MGKNGVVPRCAPHFSLAPLTLRNEFFVVYSMVRNYKRKSNRQEWSEVSMREAVEAVLSNSVGYKRASAQFSVPKTTLERHEQKKRQNQDFDGSFHLRFHS